MKKIIFVVLVIFLSFTLSFAVNYPFSDDFESGPENWVFDFPWA